ncbi:HpcH/HpaI aldolase family protein [Jeotgalibaca sp. A127]|uniref:HpcH/HpaI aldolase family protein n=1 Tax=Jeotgalibaca sp. A127 TaxID=3457324 RepID=UPI003FD3C1E2
MLQNNMISKLENDEKLLGTFVETNDTLIIEALSVAGFDYFIVDLEHSTTPISSLKELVQTADYRNITPLLRISDISRENILRALDIGIQGLVIPNVRSVEEVRRIVNWGKYPPLGQRGFFTSRLTDFGFDERVKDIETLFADMNENTLIIPQCETVESLENIEEIVAMEGVAGIFLGPYDLSIAMGIPTQFNHPKFVEAVERIRKAVNDNGKFIITFSMDVEDTKQYYQKGFHAVTFGMDTNLMINAGRKLIEEVK